VGVLEVTVNNMQGQGIIMYSSFLIGSCICVNLRWMNGQHLRALPSEELTKLIGERWKSTSILTESEGTFIQVRLFSIKIF
jgi:hypothetical protein